MGRYWIGPALALGFNCALLPPAVAEEAEAPPVALRFVADPALVRGIDPGAAAGERAIGEPLHRPAPAARQAQQPAPPAAQAIPFKPAAAEPAVTGKPPMPASWPVTLSEVRAQREAAGKVEEWAPAEVAAARARCAAVLKAINGVAEVQEPIRIGSCGTPAPIRLISFGSKPEVVISPPAVINCDMAEALHTWFASSLQPLARKHLGAPIIKIDKMSDYSCRNAYGRARGRLSEHGRVNALDIAGFSTARGDSAMLLADWGLTARDIRRQIAEAQKKAAPVTHVATPVAGRPPTTSPTASSAPATAAAAGSDAESRATILARPSIIEGAPRSGNALSLAEPAREDDEPSTPLGGLIGKLGGAVPASPPTASKSAVQQVNGIKVEAPPGAHKALFLREAHRTACGIFGTVLGPEANNAHRNHLHIDLAERGARGAFCE